jgi:hypothetical protein
MFQLWRQRLASAVQFDQSQARKCTQPDLRTHKQKLTEDRSVSFLVVGRVLGVFHRLVLLMFVPAK